MSGLNVTEMLSVLTVWDPSDVNVNSDMLEVD